MAPVAQAQGQGPPSPAVIELLLDTPALQAPPGADTTMTTDGPDQVWYLVVAITCVAIPGLFLMVRVYTKLAIVRSLEIADYFIFFAFPLIVVEVGMGYHMVKWGAGVHQWQVTLRQLFNQLFWGNTAEVIYCPLSFLVRMAILLQYLRLFAPSRQLNRWMWYGAWLTIILNFIFYTVFMFWTLFYCKPRQMIWNKLTPGGKCHDHSPIVLSQGAFNMASDIVILLLPTSSLWHLHVPLGRKVLITALFATGLLACAASTMRIIYTIKIAPVISMTDVSHNALFIGLWTEAEVALGFIVACSLCLPKLIQAKRKHFSRAFSYVSSPFSTIRSTVRSSSRKGSMFKSKSTQNSSRSSQPVQMFDRKQPVFYEEREIHNQKERGVFPFRQERDAYDTTGTCSGNNEYSEESHLNRNKFEQRTLSLAPSMQTVPLKYSNSTYSKRSSSESSIRIAPLKYSRSTISEASSENMVPSIHIKPLKYTQSTTSKFTRSLSISESATSSIHIKPLKWSSYPSPHPFYNPQPEDYQYFPPIPSSSTSNSNTQALCPRSKLAVDASVVHEDDDNAKILNGIPASGQGNRLTQEEIMVLQQFRFDNARDSMEIGQAADRAMRTTWRPESWRTENTDL